MKYITIILILLLSFLSSCKKKSESEDLTKNKNALEIYRDSKKNLPMKKKIKSPADYKLELKNSNK